MYSHAQHFYIQYTWLVLIIHAAPVPCPNPVEIDNGMVTFTGNLDGDTASYTCDMGFELIGVATTTCTQVDANSATFQPAPPSCRRKYSD